jgi:phosphocarrier protein
MRPAGFFANALAGYQSAIKLKTPAKEVNAKSLMHIIGAGLKCGMTVEVIADGPDEAEALAKAVELIDSGLGEL